MKTLKIYAGIVSLLCSFAATAANVNNNVNAESNTNSTATSAAQNAGNAQNINFNSKAADTQTLKNTPGVILGGFSGSFSSDYCGATAQGGLGLPGFSFAAGAPVIDKHCVHLRTFERTMQAASTLVNQDPELARRVYTAALDMLCDVTEESRRALERQGVCSSSNEQSAQNHQGVAAQRPIVVSSRYTGSDPIVIQRLGLQPQR